MSKMRFYIIAAAVALIDIVTVSAHCRRDPGHSHAAWRLLGLESPEILCHKTQRALASFK